MGLTVSEHLQNRENSDSVNHIECTKITFHLDICIQVLLTSDHDTCKYLEYLKLS